jgi:hypothetical protein
MKPYLAFTLFILLFVSRTLAQIRITAPEALKHIGEEVSVCDKVHLMTHAHDSTVLVLGSEHPGEQLIIVIKGFNINSDDYYRGQNVCVFGIVNKRDGKPEIVLTDPEMIIIHKVSILGKKDMGEHQKITSVVLTAPPNAHYFGDSYRPISLNDVDNTDADTIKITEKITSYKVTDDKTLIYVGGVNPNQKLTVVLTGQAKQYLDAMLEIEYKGKDLQSMRVMAIGKITSLEGKPQIVITDPNLFTIIRD